MIEDADDKPDEALTDCEQKVEELQEENAQLRESAETFGDLAERLNAERRAAKGLPAKPKALKERADASSPNKDEKSQARKGIPS